MYLLLSTYSGHSWTNHKCGLCRRNISQTRHPDIPCVHSQNLVKQENSYQNSSKTHINQNLIHLCASTCSFVPIHTKNLKNSVQHFPPTIEIRFKTTKSMVLELQNIGIFWRVCLKQRLLFHTPVIESEALAWGPRIWISGKSQVMLIVPIKRITLG